jgi:hypothetical protein
MSSGHILQAILYDSIPYGIRAAIEKESFCSDSHAFTFDNVIGKQFSGIALT